MVQRHATDTSDDASDVWWTDRGVAHVMHTEHARTMRMDDVDAQRKAVQVTHRVLHTNFVSSE